MLPEKRNYALKTWLILGGLVGLWLALVWGMPTTQLQASSMTPALLTFESPIGNPILTISKEIDKPSPRPGQTVVYTLRYANTNPGSQAFNVRLYDFLPAGVDVISTYPVYDSYVNGTMIFEAPSVGPDTTPREIIIYGWVRDDFAELYNHAIVTADGVTPTNTSLHTVVAPAVRELTFSKTGYSVVLKEDELVYELRCENTGEVPVENITVLDMLPDTVIYQSATPAPVETQYPLMRWTVGALDVGETWTASVVVTSPDTIGMITNTAMIFGDKLPPETKLFVTRVISEGAILNLTKTGAPEQLYLYDTAVYTLEYTNRGNMPADDVLLTDTLPSNIVAGGAVPVTTTVFNNTRVVWEIPTIAPDDVGQAMITITVRGQPGRTLHNTAQIGASGPDIYYDNQNAEFDIEVLFRKLYMPIMMRKHTP